jgi:hypothetical protein
LADPTQLVESFPMGLCSTSGGKNSLRYDLGPHHCDCHVSTQYICRGTPTKETSETAETHIEKRLKRLWVRIGENNYETAEVDQCWSVVAGMGQWWSEVGARVEQGH